MTAFDPDASPLNTAPPASRPAFLADPDTVRARLRPTLVAAFCLACLATLSWLGGFDFRLSEATAYLLDAGFPRTLFEAYSRWGLFLFYLPFLAMLGLGVARRHRLYQSIGVAYLMAQLLGPVLLTRLLKSTIARPRPHAMPDAAEGLWQSMHSAFPSSHTMDVAVGAVLVLLLVRAPGLRALALILAVLMGVARLGLGRHYLSDVLAALALGAATTVLVVQVVLLPRWQRHAPARTP